MNTNAIFSIQTPEEFEAKALQVFYYQHQNNPVYNEFCNFLKIQPSKITKSAEIPCLPIQFFKSHRVSTGQWEVQQVFTSSGTTKTAVSKHYVKNLALYEKSYLQAFESYYGVIEEYTILALLPSYLEREGSSLIYMANDLIGRSKNTESGFYLHDLNELKNKLIALDAHGKKTLLIGVSFALLDIVEKFSFKLKNTIIMETGGMKGKRKELIREELHQQLRDGFGVSEIHSEYGMTELLSQAYSKGNGLFQSPPWMKINIRDTEDALSPQPYGKTGGVNVIDLANIHSCSFIATQDLGKAYPNGSFEILGRFDHSDIRGCNLMML